MADLSTTYMGLSLKNPIVVASCGLTGTLDGVQKCAAAGAGAVVLKSLFEEQISAQTSAMGEYADYAGHGEAAEYLQGYGMELGPMDYLELVSEAKKAVDIPVIPSLNCISNERWSDYAHKLELAGADALELNIALLPTHARQESEAVEEQYYRIYQDVKGRVSIPVAIKLGPYFSSFAHFADRLSHDRAEAPAFAAGWFGQNTETGKIVWHAVDALVLFNRFYQLDINIEKVELVAGMPFSSSADIHYALRWMTLLSGRVGCDLAATTGVHSSEDAIKLLLAGADIVQICSTLYQKDLGQIERILEGIKDWMARHDCSSLNDFRGLLSQAKSDQPENYERLQYIKLFSDIV